MLNNEKFITRLQNILEEYDLTASAFAEKIDVGRSSISHILSGRNKPSLEFIMKINTVFPEIDLYWLLKGAAREQNQPLTSEGVPESPSVVSPEPLPREKEEILLSKQAPTGTKEIERIIILYKDGRFKDYDPF